LGDNFTKISEAAVGCSSQKLYSWHAWQVAQAQNEAHLLHHGIALCLVEGGSLKWPYGLESFGQWAKRLCQTGEITVTML